MARAVIGGLITSTLLTLFVVPVMYTFLDDVGALGELQAHVGVGARCPRRVARASHRRLNSVGVERVG